MTSLLALGIASCVGCYPVYPPGGYNSAYNQDSKDSLPQEPAQQGPPVRYGVDPGLVFAGAAAAGILGYALANNHGYGYAYYGPSYYRPVPYRRGYYRPVPNGRGYYAPRYYR